MKVPRFIEMITQKCTRIRVAPQRITYGCKKEVIYLAVF
jgi:hypothetical protein